MSVMSFKRTLFASVLGLLPLLASPALEAKSLRINIAADPAQMDPITASELVAGRVMNNVYESFTAKTGEGKIDKALALSWEPLPEGFGFRFHLRPGVKFHSGRPFTARDVKYTYEQLLLPGSKAGIAAGYLAKVVGAAEMKAGTATELKGVKVVDDQTIEVSFTSPDVLFPIYPINIMDAGIVAEQGADWVTKASAGTGPFKFKQWKRGVEVEVTANPDYWGGAPKIDSVRYLIIPSPDTALAQYEAGELDFLDVQESILRTVLRDERYKSQMQTVPRAQSRYLGMNGQVYAPFKDKRVREAVSLVLNREAMIKGLYDGAAFPLNGIITPGVVGYDPSLPKLPYDVARAKQLLADAGFPGGKGLPPVEISSTAPFRNELAYYANVLNTELGMPVSVNVVERATFIRSMNAGEVAFFPWGWTADYPDALYYLAQMWHSKSPYNRGRWSNAAYDAAIDEAVGTVDDAKRVALYHVAERAFVDDMGAAPLPMTAAVALVKPNVSNARITPFGFDSFLTTEIK